MSKNQSRRRSNYKVNKPTMYENLSEIIHVYNFHQVQMFSKKEFGQLLAPKFRQNGVKIKDFCYSQTVAISDKNLVNLC